MSWHVLRGGGGTVPRLRRDPAYSAREGFEFVAPDGRLWLSRQAGLRALAPGADESAKPFAS